VKVTLNDEFKLMIRDTPPPGRDYKFEMELEGKVPTVKWHKGWKLWWAPLGLGACRALSSMGAEFDDTLVEWLADQERLSKARETANKIRDMDVDRISGLLEKGNVRYKMKPFNHQVTSLAYALALPCVGLFLDTGLGKTCVGAMLMQALLDLFGKSKFLVIAPRTLLNTAWAEDLEKFSWLTYTNLNQPKPNDVCPVCDKHFTGGAVSWPHIRKHLKTKLYKRAGVDIKTKKKDLTEAQTEFMKVEEEKLKKQFYESFPQFKPKSAAGRVERIGITMAKTDVNVYMINPESFRLAFDEIMKVKWDGIVIDESSILKDPSSQTTQKMIRLGMLIKRKVIMSATPRPNNSMEWWAQMAFLDMCLGSSFSAYREKFFRPVDQNKYVWIPRAGADRQIRNIVFDRSIRFRLEECVDLPGEIYETHEVELNKECRTAYDEMATDYVLNLKSGERIEGLNSLVVQNKLSQIASGFIFDRDGDHHVMADSVKIEHTAKLARRLIEQEGHDCVCIWIRYSKIESKMLEERLKDLGVSTAHGHTKDTDESIKKFKDGRNKIMIANPQSVMFGHTWTHCSACIFHSYGHSWEQYYQSKRRFVRIGQKKTCLYVNVVAKDTVDEDIIKVLMRKEKQSEKIIDQVLTDSLKEKYG
jgi:SNF2 family DNA or RNA helicase